MNVPRFQLHCQPAQVLRQGRPFSRLKGSKYMLLYRSGHFRQFFGERFAFARQEYLMGALADRVLAVAGASASRPYAVPRRRHQNQACDPPDVNAEVFFKCDAALLTLPARTSRKADRCTSVLHRKVGGSK